ncbi:MAG: efflux RND transporter periplasmic adaptor subunit [Bacteroidetes bacterium]|nr:efflux RND transporter periplasmic adaptor subunit [Bacteroidota bacterium]MBX7130857.1 efflux RND transporter periplasmic adaptor subunit [Flavobacteriales bacterium]HMU15231.1 efflux RND transporter periplasmic adaptor subunit [Flavobacteriales bacterium]HMW96851.1 efflux RND transporter periplasmic adaptor subunit [Flavobacteriales bacterium]HNI04072.1 efflux RND transporter periplasmic adaptor subunit [Flavobacteriales bacterium]
MDRAIDPRPARRKRMIVLGCASSLVLIAFALWSSSFTTSRVRVEAAKVTVSTVEKGLFREFIPVTGTVQPIQTIFLDALEGGTVKQRFVEDGHMVKAGDAIIELNNPQLHMDAINREAQLLDQQNNLRNTRLAMDQQTTRLRDELLNLDKDLKRLERDGRVDAQLMKDSLLATNTFLNNQEQLVYMREKRKLLAANVRSDSVFRQSQLGSITSNLDLIQQNLRFLRENLQNLVIKAPIDGQLSGLNVELGQTKQKGERIAQIDVLGSFKVRARIPEHYVSRVSMGLLGTFTHAGKEHSIEVFKVYPEVSNGEFDVDLRFTGAQPVDIRRGQTFQVRLQLSEDLQAVMLPRGPFFQDTGGQWVYVVDAEGKAVKREVKLGRQNPDMYEVLEGLRPGDHVVTSRYAAFNDADELVIQ